MIENRKSLFSAMLQRILSATDRFEVTALMRDIADHYNLKSAAYFGIEVGEIRDIPHLVVTYSSEWVEQYKQQRYVEIDPVVQQGFRRLLPLDWEEFEKPEGELRRFFGEAVEFGLGRHGLTIPVHGMGGDRCLFTVTSDFSDRDWKDAKFEYLRDFQVLAVHLHEKVLQMEGRASPMRTLSPRELECLQWVSEGKTAWECATILGLSESTVRCYLESARYKLNAVSNTHAVSVAHENGLFFPRL